MAQILVVEDEVTLQKLFHDPLVKEGHQVSIANNGQEALEFLAKHEPDLILLDLLLPVLDGMNFLRAYNAQEHKKPAKIIILTNMYTEEGKAQAAKLGVEDFFLKADYTPHQLLDLVKEVLARK
jgi:CheY-like chemotaxis protein